jgi:hypothetical protein
MDFVFFVFTAFAKQPPGDGNRESADRHRSLSSRLWWLRPGTAETKMLAFETHNVGFLPPRAAKAWAHWAESLSEGRAGKGLRPLPCTPLHLWDRYYQKKNRIPDPQNLLRR